MKELTLKEIATALGANLLGNPNELITGLNGIMEARKGDITFLSNPLYQEHLPLCQASAVIVGTDVSVPGMNLLQIENPRLAHAKVIGLLVPPKEEAPGISDKAIVSSTARIGENCTIYPLVYIGENSRIGSNTVIYPGTFIGDDVQIGDNCLIYANVSIHFDSRIGNRVILHSGSVVGCDGYGFERDGERHFKIPQVGKVVIEDDVEIGAVCAIDRGSFKDTIIGQCTKLDNQVHIAHNCQVGENNLLTAQVALAGTVITGKNVWFGGQAGVLPHITLADKTQLDSRALVRRSIDEPGMYAGDPARSLRDWQRASTMFYKADQQRKKLSALEKRVIMLENRLEEK